MYRNSGRTADGEKLAIHSKDTIFATGGIGGLYKHSTNYPILTGDGCRIAEKHGVALEHMDYVQIHPTSFYTEEPGRQFLISESARGEGSGSPQSQGRTLYQRAGTKGCGVRRHT